MLVYGNSSYLILYLIHEFVKARGKDLVFSLGSTGTNPQFVDLNMNIPAGNYAKWYGPIFVGRKLVGELDQIADGSLRINSKSQLVIQDF